MIKHFTVLFLAAAALAGCKSSSYLTRQYAPDRAGFTNDPLPNPPVAIINPDPTGPTLPGVEAPPTITGTWTFTTPPTVTRVNHVTDQFSQFSLYMGRPAPTDKPFLVITVGEDSADRSLEPGTQISGERDYVLNSQLAHERTGHTSTGASFAELTLRHPDGGDICRAYAAARNEEQRKLALEILTSITWKPNEK